MRRLRSMVLGIVVSLVVLLPVAAHTTVSINPSSQSKNSGQLASWTAGWNGGGSTRIVFCYGDGTPCPDNTTNANSKAYSHTSYECTDQTIQQTAYVTQGGHALGRNAYTNVNGGGSC